MLNFADTGRPGHKRASARQVRALIAHHQETRWPSHEVMRTAAAQAPQILPPRSRWERVGTVREARRRRHQAAGFRLTRAAIPSAMFCVLDELDAPCTPYGNPWRPSAPTPGAHPATALGCLSSLTLRIKLPGIPG